MYNVDWDLLAKHMLPWFKRKQRFMDWLHVCLYPVKMLHSQFLTYRDETLYKLSITSQIMYLEKLLNDRFNQGLPSRGPSVNVGLYDGPETGIYISMPQNTIYPLYVWNKIEQRPKTYLYNRWRNNIQYHAGDRVVYQNKVYRALLNNVNNNPTAINTKWALQGDVTFLRNKVEIDGEYDFIVNIPIACGDVNDTLFAARVSAEIRIYLLAGRRFQLVNY